MKKLYLLIPILVFFQSCEDSTLECGQCGECEECEMIVDFGYAYDSSYISANDGSCTVPSGSSYSGYLNGSHVGNSSAEIEKEYNNGHYSILHVIEVDNIEYKKSKELEITGIK